VNPKTIIAFLLALAGVTGCIQPGYSQQPVNMPAYIASPNVGGQPGAIPVGAMVVTTNGYVYRRGLPTANLYRPSSPMAAQLRADGEALAQSDYAAAAAGASQAPTTGTPSGGTSTTPGGAQSVSGRLDSIAQQQVQLNQRVNCLENPHHRNCR
jgi:hypothetical protein